MAQNLQTTVEHLKLIQGVITRMAGNSAQMKTWTVALVTATIVFSGVSKDPSWLVGFGGCLAVIALWSMDVRYLRLQKCYVELHAAIVRGDEITEFDLDYRPYITTVYSIWTIFKSWSVIMFYGPLFVVMAILLFILAT